MALRPGSGVHILEVTPIHRVVSKNQAPTATDNACLKVPVLTLALVPGNGRTGNAPRDSYYDDRSHPTSDCPVTGVMLQGTDLVSTFLRFCGANPRSASSGMNSVTAGSIRGTILEVLEG